MKPSHEQIALRAQELWEERGSPLGSPEEDWLKAEQELMAQPPGILTKVAREVGSVVGSAVATIKASGPPLHRHHKHRK